MFIELGPKPSFLRSRERMFVHPKGTWRSAGAGEKFGALTIDIALLTGRNNREIVD